MPDARVSDGPTVSLSFANNFWGKDDAGVPPLLERMHNAKVTCDELKAFYNARLQIEDEYARKLLSLCRKPLGSHEAGTLRASLDTMRGEVESMGKAHQNIAGQMKSELEEPLIAFSGGIKERRKIVQSGIEKLLKVKVQQTQTVNKARDRYEQDCLRIKGYLAQGHMVMGQEERKNKAKLEKTQIQLANTSNEYEAAVKVLEETTGRWNREWKAACDKFQDLEEERLDFLKASLWNFANIASTVCVSDDASCEKIRLSLENCEVEKDITSFIRERGTGQEIPDPPKYINFCRGDINETASEASEDDSYSVAQFQRTINPAYRTSSPQPSTYSSHNNPQPNYAKQMFQQDPHTPPSRETTVTPHKAAKQTMDMGKPPQLDYQQAQQGPFPAVPHNEYPMDGMTMYCRTAPPSDRSSATSPARPSSRDSQSEYSQPTSFSSQEPPSGKTSPVKQAYPPVMASAPDDKLIQKKKSGFFQSHSPFRRKSKHEKENREQISAARSTPTGQLAWRSSANLGQTNEVSPTRRQPIYGRNSADMTTGGDRGPSPEPVDPRANFQLNVGNNVFDVASPDGKRIKGSPTKADRTAPEEEDPIAAALAELKGVTKQSSVRMSADRYHGLATPAPSATPSNTGIPASPLGDPNIAAAQRGTPPPSYNDPPMKRLDAPEPAFTSSAMQQTRQKYVNQAQSMFSNNSAAPPRAKSPVPHRATSPRPGIYRDRYRSASPNPNSGAGSSPAGQPRSSPGASRSSPGAARSSPGVSPTKRGGDGYGSYNSHSRYNSSTDLPRAVSPQPFRSSGGRPDSGGTSGGQPMQLQLAPASGEVAYAGRQQRPADNRRPMSYYGGERQDDRYGGSGRPGPVQQRVRSKSTADGRQFTADGSPILHYAKAMYSYTAAIPEELSFSKGDILAVLRLQDDGWWEAEVTGKKSRPGLVPSNYLQNC